MDWVEEMRKIDMLDKAPNGDGKSNFPFYLEQYLNHLKFQARK
jgi:hypothetical protein